MNIEFPACCGATIVTAPLELSKGLRPMLISGLPLEGFKEVDQGVYVLDTGRYKYVDVKLFQAYPRFDFYEEVKAMAIEAGVLK